MLSSTYVLKQYKTWIPNVIHIFQFYFMFLQITFLRHLLELHFGTKLTEKNIWNMLDIMKS
jgi:hypothetical protein